MKFIKWLRWLFTSDITYIDIPAHKAVYEIIQHIDYKIQELEKDGDYEDEINILHEIETFIYDVKIRENIDK